MILINFIGLEGYVIYYNLNSMNNKILKNFLSGFVSCFKFVRPSLSRSKDFDYVWNDNWQKVGSYLTEGLKKIEKEHERD
jgi:hypothetical protein